MGQRINDGGFQRCGARMLRGVQWSGFDRQLRQRWLVSRAGCSRVSEMAPAAWFLHRTLTLLRSAYFTTESYPAHQRLSAWRGTLERLSLHVRSMQSHGTVHGTVSSAVSPLGLTFARISSGPQELSYRNATRGGAICLSLHLEGEAVLVDEARETSIDSGDIVFGPTGASGGLSLQSEFRQLLVTIPREAFRSRLPTPLSLKVGRLPRDCGIGRVFSGMLESVAEQIHQLTAAQLHPIEIALSEFLVSNLVDAQSDAPLPDRMGHIGNEATHLHHVSQHIENRLSDPGLCVDAVADHIGVSTRYLQKLFESTGETFTHYVRLRRLERCRVDLVNPLFAHLSIGDICFRWNFSDAAHFSRAFREQYQVSPREYRREVGATISKKVLLHTHRGWPGSAGPAFALHSACERVAQEPQPPYPGLRHHHLSLSAATVCPADRAEPPRCIVEVTSGDVVTLETACAGVNRDYLRLFKVDAELEQLLNANRGEPLCTGALAVRGAQPGDVIELRIIDTRVRSCTQPHYRGRTLGLQQGGDTATVFELETNDPGAAARAIRRFDGNDQIQRRVRIPLQLHFGLISLAASQRSSAERIADARAGKGATLYLPVRVAGGLLSVGRPRASSAIECSLTGVFQLILHRRRDWEHAPHSVPAFPLLETADEWVISTQMHDQSALELCIAELHRNMTGFLMTGRGLSADEARTAVSVALDVDVTHADGRWSARASLRKALIE
jgi:AraC-like DNA-binding protein/acetamidase/formamidase